MRLEFRGGVKSTCSKGFGCLKRSILTWLNGRTVEHLNSSIFVKFFNISTIKLKNLFTTHYSQFTKKLFAFTLAETLIVMGVIGVVAALTLPNLNQSTGNKEKVAKVKKIVSNIEDALGRAQAVYGPVDEWFVNDTDNTAKQKRFGSRFTEFLKVSKDCGTDTNKGCFSSSVVKFTNGGDDNEYFDTGLSSRVILADGTSLRVVRYDGSLIFYFDIDGPNKGPNTYGIDIFYISYSLNNNSFDYTIDYNSDISGYYAAKYILKHDNMDYLKTSDGHTCPDGQKLSETHTTCK